jgi:hypothetical protein
MPPVVRYGQAAIPCGFGGHRGNIVAKIGESQRILPRAVQQRFEMSSSGALDPATKGSTRPVSVTVTKAVIATVEQFDLRVQ